MIDQIIDFNKEYATLKGLKNGDAKTIKNAGGVTDETLDTIRYNEFKDRSRRDYCLDPIK